MGTGKQKMGLERTGKIYSKKGSVKRANKFVDFTGKSSGGTIKVG